MNLERWIMRLKTGSLSLANLLYISRIGKPLLGITFNHHPVEDTTKEQVALHEGLRLRNKGLVGGQ